MRLRKIFIMFLLSLSVHHPLLGAAAAATKKVVEPISAEEYAAAIHAFDVHKAFANTRIPDAILKGVIFLYLGLRDTYTPRLRFDGIQHKLASTPDRSGFYAINYAHDLSHYSCRTGTVTRLTGILRPAGYCFCLPGKSWIHNNHLVAIASYTNIFGEDISCHLSSINLNPPYATRFHRLNSKVYRQGPKLTPAVLLATGIVVCDESEFTLQSTNHLEVLQRFNRPTYYYSYGHALKRINGREFVGQFSHLIFSENRVEFPNEFCHYDVAQSAPLHSFTTASSWPRIFPCRDERTAILTDRTGRLAQCTYDGTTQTDYTRIWNRKYFEPSIAIIPDGNSFVAHRQDKPGKVAQFHFANPTTPTIIDDKKISPATGKLMPISSTELLAKGSFGTALVHLDNNTTEILDPDISQQRISAISDGFITVKQNLGRVIFWSRQNPIAASYQAGAETSR